MGIRGQAGQKTADLKLPHFHRVPLVMGKDKTLGPADVGLFGRGLRWRVRIAWRT
jgi:hypothetical protein